MPLRREDIEIVKESGRRRVLRVRFREIYGLDEHFIVKTLLRGEISDSYRDVGYPERRIPENKPATQFNFNEKIFALAILETPKNFNVPRSPAAIVDEVARIVLYESGAIEGSDQQNSCLDKGLRYANSMDGRGDALILRYLNGVSSHDLGRMNQEEWAGKVFQSILLAKILDGYDLREFLTPSDENSLECVFAQADVMGYAPALQSTKAPTSRPEVPTNRRSQALKSILQEHSKSISSSHFNMGGKNTDVELTPRMFIAGETYRLKDYAGDFTAPTPAEQNARVLRPKIPSQGSPPPRR